MNYGHVDNLRVMSAEIDNALLPELWSLVAGYISSVEQLMLHELRLALTAKSTILQRIDILELVRVGQLNVLRWLWSKPPNSGIVHTCEFQKHAVVSWSNLWYTVCDYQPNLGVDEAETLYLIAAVELQASVLDLFDNLGYSSFSSLPKLLNYHAGPQFINEYYVHLYADIRSLRDTDRGKAIDVRELKKYQRLGANARRGSTRARLSRLATCVVQARRDDARRARGLMWESRKKSTPAASS